MTDEQFKVIESHVGCASMMLTVIVVQLAVVIVMLTFGAVWLTDKL